MVKFRGSREVMKKRPRKRNNFEDDDDDDEIESERNNAKKWYENIPKEPQVFESLSDAEVNRLKDEARMVLENDTIHYRNKCSSGTNKSDNNWLQTMVTKGTFQDKLAASVLLVQNSPLHGLHTIGSLINQVKTSKKYCTKVMDVLTDLFISDLLIPNKKLRPFEKCPLSMLEKLSDGNLLKRKSFLSYWYFEDQLKNEYRNFIQAVRDVGQDTVDSNRMKSITAMQKLLTSHPEQEAILLSNLVNKIGDSSASVASSAVLHLKKVLREHPNMKPVFLNEIEKLLFRTNIKKKAQYFGICFLSQILFKKDDEELASKFLQLYFSFFKGCIKQGEVDSRMMSILLTGVNRAFPFAKKDTIAVKDHIDTLYRVVHIAQYGVSLQTLCLLFQVSDCETAISDRFYSVLYQHILHPSLSRSSSQHAMFVSLVFRAMCKDVQFNRTKVFVKRLLQICHYVPATLACGILIMLSHLFEKFSNLLSVTLVATKFKEEDEENEDGDGEHYVDVPLEEVKEENQNPSGSENCEIEENKIEHSEKMSEEKKPVISSWFHVENVKDGTNFQKDKLRVDRNPLFLADKLNVYTELVSLSSHFHPTVSLFANHLLEGKKIEYTGDPLRDFNLTRFLDRWVFKNPKKLKKNSDTKLSRRVHTPYRMMNCPINSEKYLNACESHIPTEELFIYRFLKKQQEKGKNIKNKKDDEDDDDSDVSSVASDEFDGIMDQLMGGKEEINYSEGIKSASAAGKKKKQKVESDDDYGDNEDEMDDEPDNSDISDNEEDSDLESAFISENEGEDDEVIDYEKIKEEFSDLDEIEDDEAAIVFDDDGEDDFSFTMSDVEKDDLEHKQKKKNKKANSEGKKLKKGIDRSIFAPAEEFAEMLEDTGDQLAKYGNLATISNKDNAGMKQLKWEMSRNQWIHGHRDKRKKNGRFSKQPTKKFKKR